MAGGFTSANLRPGGRPQNRTGDPSPWNETRTKRYHNTAPGFGEQRRLTRI
jgi:hypothetical protein